MSTDFVVPLEKVKNMHAAHRLVQRPNTGNKIKL